MAILDTIRISGMMELSKFQIEKIADKVYERTTGSNIYYFILFCSYKQLIPKISSEQVCHEFIFLLLIHRTKFLLISRTKAQQYS